MAVTAPPGCNGDPDAPVAVSPAHGTEIVPPAPGAAAPPGAMAPAHFTVRGRWPTEPHLTYAIEDQGAPLPVADWRDAVERALAVWTATGSVRFSPAVDGARADVTFGFRRGHHGACEPFGTSSAVAHAGPVQPGTFVHFDQDRPWQADAAQGLSLFRTALHETGHVLGLGHSEDERALMRVGTTYPPAPGPDDLAGLASLYGGGEDGPADLRVLAADDAAPTAVLRGVAPPDRTVHAIFDVDGDGRDEVLVLRTDRAGHGMLMVYRFAPGPALARTDGPYYGVAVPGGDYAFVRTPAGQRLLVVAHGDRTSVRGFDEHGQPGAAQAGPELVAAALRRARAERLPEQGDLDGDGRRDRIEY